MNNIVFVVTSIVLRNLTLCNNLFYFLLLISSTLFTYLKNIIGINYLTGIVPELLKYISTRARFDAEIERSNRDRY